MATSVLALAVLALAPVAGAHEGVARAPARPRARAAVIGGLPAEAGTLPWMAYVLDDRGTEVGQCTGTVVAPNLILTAAHCAENVQSGVPNEASGYSVLTGSVDWAAPQAQLSHVARVIVCSCFDRHTLVGDVALLELSTPTTAPAVTLASSPPPVGQGALFAGWGETYPNQTGTIEQARWAPTVVQSSTSCQRDAPPFGPGSEICTLDSPTLQTGACHGDSGGPLLVREPSAVGGMVEIGVVSHGYDECATATPSVFTSVAPVSAWVRGWEQALAPGAGSAPASDEAVPPPLLEGIASTGSLRVASGRISLALACDSEGGICTGDAEATMRIRVTFTGRRDGVRSTATEVRDVRLIRASFAMAPGAAVVVRTRLSGSIRALLARLAHAPIAVALTGKGVVDRVVTLALS